MDREPSREASPAAATEPGSAGGTSSLTSVSDVWDERNDQRWIDPRAGPAPTVSRVLYQLYWTIPVGLPPGHRALMRLDDALGRICRNACFRAWQEEWRLRPLAEWTKHRIHDIGGWTGTGSPSAAMRRIGTNRRHRRIEMAWRGLVNRFATKEKLVPEREMWKMLRALSRGVATLRGFQMGMSQVRALCGLSFPKPFVPGSWDNDRFSVRQMLAKGTSDLERQEFADQAEATWQAAIDALAATAKEVAQHAKNRFTREGLPLSEEQIRAQMKPDPPPDELHPPRRGFERTPAERAQQPSTQGAREPSVLPENMRQGDGHVRHPDRRGWLSGAHGHYGREVAPRDWWLGKPPLSLEERASLVARPTRLGGLGWTIWVCFGCARPCNSCHKRAGQHCAQNCQGRANRCARNKPAAVLEWHPETKCWKWPYTDWNAEAMPPQFWSARANAFLVPPAFLRDMSEERDFAAREFQPPWVLHIKGGRGPAGTVPCLEHDGRIALGTDREIVPFCVSQNDLINGGNVVGYSAYEQAPPWENRFEWMGESFTQDKWLCLGPVNEQGVSQGANLCRNVCQCSYWLCDGWVRDAMGYITGRCWSAARHRSGGREIYY